VLRCILRHCDVLSVRLIPQDLRALNLELFTLPSSLDFLEDPSKILQTRDRSDHQVPGFYGFIAMTPRVTGKMSMIPIDYEMSQKLVRHRPITVGHDSNMPLILSSK
jgi:hypothetical protein